MEHYKQTQRFIKLIRLLYMLLNKYAIFIELYLIKVFKTINGCKALISMVVI